MKVSLDEQILNDPRLDAMCRSLHCDRPTVVGALALLWHATRAGGFERGSAQELFGYLPVEPARRPGLLQALLAAGYVRKDGLSFAVVGNAEHFVLISKRREAGKKGRAATELVGKARLKRRAELAAKKAKPAPKPKPARRPRAAAADTEASAANRATWDAYREAYAQRWRVEPTRNARVNACIAQFVQRVGRDDAPAIMRFFVRHNDHAYLRSQHQVTFAVRDAEALRTQWQRGQAITSQDLPAIERANALAEQIRRIEDAGVRAGLQERGTNGV